MVPLAASTSRLTTRISGLTLRNPTMLASGILGSSGSMLRRVALEGMPGAVVTRSITSEPRLGFDPPIIVKVECGFVNAVGLAGPGYEEYLPNELPIAKQGGVPVIVSVAGRSAKEFGSVSASAEEYGADAVELNLSCPHVAEYGIEIGSDPSLTYEITSAVKSTLKIPVFVKLGLCDGLKDVARRAEDAGADGITAINTVKAMVIDIHARLPALTGMFGGLSGPAIHPIAVRCVYELYDVVEIPIVGVGGVVDWRSAVQLMLAGARAVQIGSAIAVKGMGIFREVIRGIVSYLDLYGFSSVEDIVGIAHRR